MNAHRHTIASPSGGVASKRSNRISAFIGYGSISIVLVASATKNNTDTIADSEWWGEYTDAAIIATLKGFYPLILLVAAAILLAGALRTGRRLPRLRPCTLLLMILYSYIFFRAFLPAPELAFKYVLTLAVTLGVALNLGYAWLSESAEESANNIFRALFVGALWVVLTNFYNILTGNGSVPGAQRLIGVAGHPNFTGVQLALGAPFFLFGALVFRRFTAILSFACLPISVYMILMTGSRTALVVLVVALGLAVVIRLRLSLIQLAALSIIGILVTILSYYALKDAGYVGLTEDSAFYRGENTRAETFAYLLRAVGEHPIAGVGYFQGLPENSLLRGWAAFGVGIPILLAVLLTTAVIQWTWLSKKLRHGSAVSALSGCYGGVLVGSLLEGYLVDAFSYSMLIFCVLTLFSDRASAFKTREMRPNHLHSLNGTRRPI